jgi:hypothetical protein
MCKLDFSEGNLPAREEDEKLRGRTAIQDYLGRLPAAREAREAGKPSMLYFYVTTPKAVAGKRARPSRQVTACLKVQRLFDGSNTSIGTAAKFFVLSDIDVSKVSVKDNPIFNSHTAPAIAFLDSKGKIASILSGKITSSSLLRAMVQTLSKSGIRGAKVTLGARILKQILKLENEKASATQRRTDAARGLSEAKRKRQASRMASEQNVIRKADATLKRVVEILAEQNKLWENLFKK